MSFNHRRKAYIYFWRQSALEFYLLSVVLLSFTQAGNHPREEQAKTLKHVKDLRKPARTKRSKLKPSRHLREVPMALRSPTAMYSDRLIDASNYIDDLFFAV